MNFGREDRSPLKRADIVERRGRPAVSGRPGKARPRESGSMVRTAAGGSERSEEICRQEWRHGTQECARDVGQRGLIVY